MSNPSDSDEARPSQLQRQAEIVRVSVEEFAQLQISSSHPDDLGAAILVTDDSADLRATVRLNLEALGYHNVTEAADGQIALDLLRQREFDLLILDVEMPRVNGYQVLAELKADPLRREIPVIVASGYGQLETVARCIELGAEDFLSKPINSVLLGARMAAALERKRLREMDHLRLYELQRELHRLENARDKSERLLQNILPVSIAHRLKQGELTIAQRYACVTVLFADLVGFTNLSNHSSPEELVSVLNDMFSRFDRLADIHGVEKIKTIGDCYLAVGGLPIPRANHAESVAEMALEMLGALEDLNRTRGTTLALRIGINSGPVIAGIIGHKTFSYDLWGATVNLAHRMQSSGPSNRVHLTAATGDLLRGKFIFTERGTVDCKGLGEVRSCLLERKMTALEEIVGPGATFTTGPET